MTILHIDSSARNDGSVSRQLTAQIVARLGGEVIRRDVAEGLPFVHETWVNANFTPADQRDAAQQEILALSDTLIGEVKAADTLVIGAPMYNFGVPASLKAWVDLICRAGLTFNYTENGPVGLLTGKRAIVVMSTGGVKVGSEVDFASGYIRQVLGFIGISDVTFIAADQLMANGDEAVASAASQVEQLAA